MTTVGIDLVSPETILDSIATHGERYLERVYTRRELSEATTSRGLSGRRLAGSFAAKEATIKVLRPANDVPVPWHEIEVQSLQPKLCRLTLSGSTATLARKTGLDGLALSISYEQGLALAVVIAKWLYATRSFEQ
jgi:holo-[acyl-carrier protein] synthase